MVYAFCFNILVKNVLCECDRAKHIALHGRLDFGSNHITMKATSNIPMFVSVISVLIGCCDLLRGFMHTILLHYSATNIAVLDLTTSTARDQLKLLGAFGVSNLETGIAMILVGLFARKIALAMLGAIPLVYAIGYFTIRYNSEDTAPSTAHWGGVPMLKVYLCVCLATFIAGVVVMRRRGSAQQIG